MLRFKPIASAIVEALLELERCIGLAIVQTFGVLVAIGGTVDANIWRAFDSLGLLLMANISDTIHLLG